jgi:hypothetical protein
LIQVFGFSSFHIKNSFDLIYSISKLTPFILYKKPSTNSTTFYTVFKNNLNSGIIKSVFNNFYLHNSILRNSKIMSLCHNRFKIKHYNFF